jgi:hypothetical protein
MDKHVFSIEFRFPAKPSGDWVSFFAKVREATLTGIWEVYSFSSDDQTKLPVDKVFLKKQMGTWIEVDNNKETLLSALIGRAIDKRTQK